MAERFVAPLKLKLFSVNNKTIKHTASKATKKDLRDKMCIMRLEREDGTIPDFCYCEHTSRRTGFIFPKPFALLEQNIRRLMTTQEVR